MIFSAKKPLSNRMFITSLLKKEILVQDRGGGEILTGGILKYFEDLNFDSNKDIGPKDFFEMACSHCYRKIAVLLMLLLLFLQSGLFMGSKAAAESTSDLTENKYSEPSEKKQDFLLGQPKEFLGIHTGVFFPQADSGVFDFITRELTLGKSDFRAWDFGADLGVNLREKIGLVFNFDTSKSSADSEFRDFVDEQGLPITQKTSLLETSITAGIKYSLRSPGRRLGEFAFLPTRVVPFIEGGAGFLYYNFNQKGYFVDNATSEIFYAILKSSGWTEVAYLGGGADIYLKRRTYLTLALRYSWASDALNKNFIGFDDINLSGLRLIAGIRWCFF